MHVPLDPIVCISRCCATETEKSIESNRGTYVQDVSEIVYFLWIDSQSKTDCEYLLGVENQEKLQTTKNNYSL